MNHGCLSRGDFAIGRHLMPNRVLLAPMASITDAPFRQAAQRHGAGLVVSEMIASEWLADGDPSAALRAERTGVGLHVVQLAGCEARWLGEGARVAEAAGADIIDINMGCPAKHVTAGQAGAALLRDIDHATRLMETVVAAVRVPVTLKMRLGWDERSIVAPDLAQRAEAAGIAMITVHGRTRCQFYDGCADWSAITRVKAAVNVPVVANGDLASFEGAQAMFSASAADAVMVGRAARGRPWFPGQLARYLETGIRAPDPVPTEQRDILLALYDAWLVHYGRKRGVREARKHLGWALEAAACSCGRSTEWLKFWRGRLVTEEEPTRVARNIRDAFDDLAWGVAA